MSAIRQRYLDNLNQVFSRFQMSDSHRLKVLAAIPAFKNARVLFTGVWGTGKTTLAEAIMKCFFSNNAECGTAKVAFHQELTEGDFLYFIDFFEQPGKVTPARLLSQPVRFFNEIHRAAPSAQNALLSFLSEREVTFRDRDFTVVDGLDLFDRNPDDNGSEGIIGALLDRIDMEIIIPPHFFRKTAPCLDVSPMTAAEMSLVWQSIDEIRIPEPIWIYARMLARYPIACIQVPRAETNPSFHLPCERCPRQNHLCAGLRSVPGERPLQSMEALAKIIAWLEGRIEVTSNDLLVAFPFVYSHRLQFRESLLRQHYSTHDYLRSVVSDILLPARSYWLEAVELYLAEDKNALTALLRRYEDPVLAWLQAQYDSRDLTTSFLQGILTNE